MNPRPTELREAIRQLEQEISRRQQAEQALARVQRILQVLSECNRALVHAAEEPALLRRICQVLVETGGYRLAWVGFVEHDGSKTIRPVAQAGYEEGYLDTLDIAWDDSERGRGPTGTAVRTGKPSIARDIFKDPRFAPWRTEAVKRGYASSIALPLKGDQQVFGTLNIYATEPDAFDEEEIGLLSDLAHNLAFGVTALRTRVEREKAEKALRKSEARYRAIVEDQTELICRHLSDTTLTFVNNACCRYFGKKHQELIGRSFLSLVPEEERERAWSHLGSLGPDKTEAVFEHSLQGPDGKMLWLEWKNRMILDHQNRPLELQSVGRDITRRKQMEEALKKSAEEIKFFAYSVSHDLKSPTVALHGLTERLHKRYKDVLGDKGRSYCEQILKASVHIAALIEQINAYITTKEKPLKIENVDLKEILHTVRSEFSRRLKVRQVSWVEPEVLPETRADRLSLLRVFTNFVDNALKYGGENLSEIRIGYSATSEFHILSVSDNGAGLTREDYRKILAALQAQEAMKDGTGTGLGLAIVREIAEQHGGTVWTEPVQDRGSTFYISISKSL